MGYLLPILVALGSLALEDFSSVSFPWAVPSLLVVPYAAAFLSRRQELAGRFRAAGLIDRVSRILPTLMQYLAVGVLGWMESLELWLSTDISLFVWPKPSLLLAIAPFVGYTLATIDAEGRWGGLPPGPMKVMRGFQTRMFLSGLGPMVAYVLLASLVGVNDLLRLGIQEVSLWSFGFSLLVGMGFITLMPLLLRWTWDTETLTSGPEFELMTRVAQMAKFRCREVLVWRTGNMMANAAIVGLFPAGRRVFLTDALLAQSGPRQLAAVYAHEIGHAKRGHVFLFLVCSLAFFLGFDLLLEWFAVEQEWIASTALVVAAGAWMLGFGWLSRRIELDADLFSLELLRDGIGITSALQMIGGAPNRHSWRHFSPQARIDFLESVLQNRELGRSLRRRLRVIFLVGAAVLGVSGAVRLRSVAGDYPLERAVVDLRLGHYTQAANRLESIVSADAEDLRELACLAEEESLGDMDSPEQALASVTGLATKAFEVRDLDRATGWLALASYLGDREAGSAARWLMEPDDKSAPTDLGPWQASIEEVLENSE
ncbi:MAG: Zn-dependent protease with chaperone function [Candidatus Paceibacteria bacterium]|jgi:Zn-dependent protease with chaperone function